MRQAGRYLPEYRALRAEKGGFLALVNDEVAAAEITLQPIRRFGFDGAILFSDILMVPYAMGQDLRFLAGEGPRFRPGWSMPRWRASSAAPERLTPIYATVEQGQRRNCPPRPRCWALPAARGPSPPIWSRAMAAATRTKPAALAYRDRQRFRRDHRRDHGGARSIISRRPDRGRRRGGAIVRQLGGTAWRPREFERWVIAPNAADRRGAEGAPSRRAGDRLSQGCRRKAARLCPRDRGRRDRRWTKRSTRLGRKRCCPRDCRCRAISTRSSLLAGGGDLDAAALPSSTHLRTGRISSTSAMASCQYTPIAHVEQLLDIVRTGETRLSFGMLWVLTMTYLWLKAGHIIFVIFWMAGLFMLPRFFVYHQECAPNSPEDALWVDRERKLLEDHPVAGDGAGMAIRPGAGRNHQRLCATVVSSQTGSSAGADVLPALACTLCPGSGPRPTAPDRQETAPAEQRSPAWRRR